jgi:hypothetical protein
MRAKGEKVPPTASRAAWADRGGARSAGSVRLLMSDLIFLKEYDGQTVEELVALEGTHRVDSLVCAFATALWTKANRHGLESLTEEELIVLAVETMEQQVMNGGFWHFVLHNLTYAADIVEALQRIGCPITAAITATALEAMRLPELTFEAVWEAREREDPERDRVIGECNEQFFRYPEDIARALYEFIKVNIGRISF